MDMMDMIYIIDKIYFYHIQEKAYIIHVYIWVKNTESYYLLGGHTGTLYICYKQSCLKKLTNFGVTSQIGCMINIENIVFIACWDGKLTHI